MVKNRLKSLKLFERVGLVAFVTCLIMTRLTSFFTVTVHLKLVIGNTKLISKPTGQAGEKK